jgi:DHA2 family multidrug resistance protein
MAIGLSALQTVLEEGNKDDWFDSPFILRLAIVAAVFLRPSSPSSSMSASRF